MIAVGSADSEFRHNKRDFCPGASVLMVHDQTQKVGSGLGLMGWSLLPNALPPFKIYCASPSIISQLVLFMWQTQPSS